MTRLIPPAAILMLILAWALGAVPAAYSLWAGIVVMLGALAVHFMEERHADHD